MMSATRTTQASYISPRETTRSVCRRYFSIQALVFTSPPVGEHNNDDCVSTGKPCIRVNGGKHKVNVAQPEFEAWTRLEVPKLFSPASASENNLADLELLSEDHI